MRMRHQKRLGMGSVESISITGRAAQCAMSSSVFTQEAASSLEGFLCSQAEAVRYVYTSFRASSSCSMYRGADCRVPSAESPTREREGGPRDVCSFASHAFRFVFHVPCIDEQLCSCAARGGGRRKRELLCYSLVCSAST